MVGAKILSKEVILPPPDTALGALANHLISQNDDFQPMNINFGLFKSSINNLKGKKNRRERYSNLYIDRKVQFSKLAEGNGFCLK